MTSSQIRNCWSKPIDLFWKFSVPNGSRCREGGMEDCRIGAVRHDGIVHPPPSVVCLRVWIHQEGDVVHVEGPYGLCHHDQLALIVSCRQDQLSMGGCWISPEPRQPVERSAAILAVVAAIDDIHRRKVYRRRSLWTGSKGVLYIVHQGFQ